MKITNPKLAILIEFVFIFFAEYYESSYYSQYECNVPLLDRAVISATSALRERGPENARLNGKCFSW